jgi:hypothetical protein
VGQCFVEMHRKPPLNNHGPENSRRKPSNRPKLVSICAAHGGGFPRENAREMGVVHNVSAPGRGDPQALVLNSAPFFLKSDVLKAYSSPVAYLSDHEFNEMIHKIAANVVRERDLLSSINRGLMVQILLNMFKFAILCTKHPAFAEEKEWRIAYTPGLLSSVHLTRHVRTLKGVTQPVYDLPLKDVEQEGLIGIEVPQLVHKIIIGPTQYLSAAHSALWYLLEEAGVSNPGERIVVSGVPLRT